jgi:hypothetical protein
MACAGQRSEGTRMPNALQLFAVSALIGECQSLLASKALNSSQQASLRCLIAHAQAAFARRTAEEEAAVASRDAF